MRLTFPDGIDESTRERTIAFFENADDSIEEAIKLIREGICMEATDAVGQSVFLMAALDKPVEIIKAMIAQGANLEATDSEGLTPLHIMVTSGHTPNLSVLIENGANIESRSSGFKYTPLAMAVLFNSSHTLPLIQHGSNINVQAMESVSLAAKLTTTEEALITRCQKFYRFL